MAYQDPFDQLANVPGGAGDVAREDLSAPSAPLETPNMTAARIAGQNQQEAALWKNVQAVKAKDLSFAGTPSYADNSGTVQPVTDPTGAPVTDYNSKANLGYDGAGNPVEVRRGEDGTPVTGDAFENVGITTDPKTGDQYKIRAGAPWQWQGQDDAIVQQNLQKEKDAAVNQAATTLGRKLTLDERDYHHDNVDYTHQAKAVAKQFGLDGSEDPDTAAKKISDSFNNAVDGYASPAANETDGWFPGSGNLTPQAQTMRAQIDQNKAAALGQLSSLTQSQQDLATRKSALDVQHAQQQALVQMQVDRANARLTAAGVTLPDGTTPNAPRGTNDVPQNPDSVPPPGDTNQPTPQAPTPDDRAAAIQDAALGKKPYTVDDKGALQLSKDQPLDSINQAVKDGLLPQPPPEVMLAAAKQQKLVADAGSHPEIKAALAGAGRGAAFLASAPVGAGIGASLLSESGPGAAVGGIVGGLISGTLGSFAYGKLVEKLGQYNSTINSFVASQQLHPGYAAAGEFAAFGAGLPKALMKGAGALIEGGADRLAAASQVTGDTADAVRATVRQTAAAAKAAEAATGGTATVLQSATPDIYSRSSDIVSAIGKAYSSSGGGLLSTINNLTDLAKVAAAQKGPGFAAAQVAKRIGISAAGMVVMDTALKEGSKAFGLSDEGQTWGGAGQAALLGAFASGHGIEMKGYSSPELGDIFLRGMAHDVTGTDPARTVDMARFVKTPDINTNSGNISPRILDPLTPEEQEIYSAFNQKAAQLIQEGKIPADPAKWQAKAKQILFAGRTGGIADVDISEKPGSGGGSGPESPATAPSAPQIKAPETPGDVEVIPPAKPPGKTKKAPPAEPAAQASVPAAESTATPAKETPAKPPAGAGTSTTASEPAVKTGEASGKTTQSPPVAEPETAQPIAARDRKAMEDQAMDAVRRLPAGQQPAAAKAVNVAVAAHAGLRQEMGKTKDPVQKAKINAALVTQEAKLRALAGAAPAASIDAAAHEAATSPHNDKDHGQLGHIKVGPLDISIEHPAGTSRNPEKGWPALRAHYGYVKGATSGDGENTDVFVKPGTPEDHNGPVWVSNRHPVGDKGDVDHKAIIGADSAEDAARIHNENYPEGLHVQPQDLAKFETGESFKKWATGASFRRAPAKGDAPNESATQEKAATGPMPPAEQKGSGKWTSDAQKQFSKFKGDLTKAEKAKDWPRVIEEAKKFTAYYDALGAYPDDWARWERAAEDAKLALKQKDETKGPPAAKTGSLQQPPNVSDQPAKTESAPPVSGSAGARSEESRALARRIITEIHAVSGAPWNEVEDGDKAAWVSPYTQRVSYNPAILEKWGDSIEKWGGNREAWIRAAVSEEDAHWRGMKASGGIERLGGIMQDRLWSDAPEALKKAMIDAYGKPVNSYHAGVELEARIYQRLTKQPITESTIPHLAKEAKALEEALDAWDIPAWLARHLETMQRISAVQPSAEQQPEAAPAQQPARPEDDPKFKAALEDAKVLFGDMLGTRSVGARTPAAIDETVYHSTAHEGNLSADPERIAATPGSVGIYTTPDQEAATGWGGPDAKVRKFHVRLFKPFDLRDVPLDKEFTRAQLVEMLNAKGLDITEADIPAGYSKLPFDEWKPEIEALTPKMQAAGFDGYTTKTMVEGREFTEHVPFSPDSLTPAEIGARPVSDSAVYGAPIEKSRLSAFVKFAETHMETIDSPAMLARLLTALDPKAPQFSQRTWYAFKFAGAEGPDAPDWTAIYGAQQSTGEAAASSPEQPAAVAEQPKPVTSPAVSSPSFSTAADIGKYTSDQREKLKAAIAREYGVDEKQSSTIMNGLYNEDASDSQFERAHKLIDGLKLSESKTEEIDRHPEIGDNGSLMPISNRFNAAEIASENDPSLIASALINGVRLGGDKTQHTEQHLATLAALLRAKETGMSWSDIAKYLDGLTTRNSGTMSGKVFLFSEWGQRIKAFADEYGIQLPAGDLEKKPDATAPTPQTALAAPKPANPRELLHSTPTLEKVTLPKGATMLRAIDAKGRVDDVRAADLRGANPLYQAGPFRSVQAGIVGQKGKFLPVKGEISVTPRLPEIGARNPEQEPAEPFFAKLPRVIAAMPQETMTVDQARSGIEKGAKRDEVAMSGILTDPLSPLVDQPEGTKVTKKQLQDYAIERQAKVKDVSLGFDRAAKLRKEIEKAIQNTDEDDLDAEEYPDWAGDADTLIHNGNEALKLLDEGDLDGATELARENSRIEGGYGDDPTWGAARAAADGKATFGDSDEATHFEQYQLPGGEPGSYREQFVTWPKQPSIDTTEKRAAAYAALKSADNLGFDTTHEAMHNVFGHSDYRQRWDLSEDEAAPIEAYLEAHFKSVNSNWIDGHSQYKDIQNPIVRIRRNIRTDTEGNKTLFLEEMQGPSASEQDKMPPEIRKRIYEIGMKRAIREAAAEGATRLGWTTGQQQAERYDLSKKVKHLEYHPSTNELYVYDHGNNLIHSGKHTPEELPSVVGKEASQKLLAQEQDEGFRQILEGVDLKVGGEGLKALYDVTLPRIANEIAKKFGAKTGEAKIQDEKRFTVHEVSDSDGEGTGKYFVRNKSTGEESSDFDSEEKAMREAANMENAIGGVSIHSLPLPEALRDKALYEGFPLLGARNPEEEASDAAKAAGEGRSDTRADTRTATKAQEKESLSVAQKYLQKLMDAGQSLVDKFTKLPEVTDFKAALGEFLGAGADDDTGAKGLQHAKHDARELSKAIKDAVPNPLSRMAISRYIEADGDKDVLRQQADASKPKFAPIYERALNLSPAELKIAEVARKFFNDIGEQAQKLGILGEMLEGYVARYVDQSSIPENEKGAKIAQAVGDVATSRMKTSFDRAIHRVFKNLFALEQEGYRVHSSDIAEVMAAYSEEMNSVVAARTFIKKLSKLNATDGRPLAVTSGYARKIEGDAEKPDGPLLVKPFGKPEDARDYLPIDHPALRKYKWVSADSEGNPIMVQGEMLIHPEIHQHLTNTLGKSALNKVPIIRAIGEFQHAVKSMMLSWSLFHYVQEGTHAIGHGVNPFKLHRWSPNDPVTRELINAGLMLINWDAKRDMAEGLGAKGGLLSHIPGIGPLNDQLTSFLFEDYIPGLKVAMAIHAHERNLKRFAKELASGKITRAQVAQKTAQQANDAFGEQNARYRGDNPTHLHAERIAFLAPDFLKSRLRFFADAFTTHGGEQRRALIILAVVMAVTAKLIERMITGRNDHRLSKIFAVVTPNREYELRSVPGDVIEAITDPRRFVSGRLSPLVSRTALEAITGRDYRGLQRTGSEQLMDLLKTAIPMSVRGAVDAAAKAADPHLSKSLQGKLSTNSSDISGGEQLASAMGARVKRRSDITDTSILGHEWRKAQGLEGEDVTYPPSKYIGLRDALEDGDIKRAREEFATLVRQNEGIANADALKKGFRESMLKPFSGGVKTEPAFVTSLDTADRATYNRALLKRNQILSQFNQIAGPARAAAPRTLFTGFP